MDRRGPNLVGRWRGDTKSLIGHRFPWRHLARVVARAAFDTIIRTGPLSRVCQFLNFSNRTRIKGDTANFVKPCSVQIPRGEMQENEPSLMSTPNHSIHPISLTKSGSEPFGPEPSCPWSTCVHYIERASYYQCTNPTIIVRQHDQGASMCICRY